MSKKEYRSINVNVSIEEFKKVREKAKEIGLKSSNYTKMCLFERMNVKTKV